jgi:hypothetical protein
MRRILQTISWVALALSVLPSLLLLAGQIELDQVKWIMLAATIVWFAATPLWMGRQKAAAADEP